MESQSIGARIRQRRTELGLKQLQIKETTGISSGNLSDIENGKKLPSTPAILALSDILDCSTDWILKGNTSKINNSFLLNEREKKLLSTFQQLSSYDQEEILEIIQLKIRRKSKSITNT